MVSLITVEYDVREDQPEETNVFKLEQASDRLIEKLIQERFSYISPVDAYKIASFSGGNARIAISLANTVNKGQTLANLKDNDLFNRLFLQRNNLDNHLQHSAEVCSLVYSFDCRTSKNLNLELKLLSLLTNISIQQLYANITELKRRDLIQQRSVWRAVLPHAIATRLAQKALENIPLDTILDTFEQGGAERLLQSFSRRLSYLHDCEIAIDIATRWLSSEGMLANVSNLNDLEMAIFKNIAPINPEASLLAFERAAIDKNKGREFTSRGNKYFLTYTQLLRSLAYDAALFERCTQLLCRFALSEKPDEKSNSIRSMLKSLFHLYLSGTHASADQRLVIIKRLLDSRVEEQQELGLLLLDAALEAWHFSSLHGFDFGARSRNYGYSPSTGKDIKIWYSLFVDFSIQLVSSETMPLLSDKIKKLLAEKFRGLWIKAYLFDELEEAVQKITKKHTWNEGWVSVRAIIRLDAENMEQSLLIRLQKMEELLAPKSLLEKVRIYALSSHNSLFDFADFEERVVIDGYDQIDRKTRSLGKQVVLNELVFTTLLPEILTIDGARLHIFGVGLAEGCTDIIKIWRLFREQLELIGREKCIYHVLCGFLHQVSLINTELSETMLNEAVTDPILGYAFIELQTAVEINHEGIQRLKKSLSYGMAPIHSYQYLAGWERDKTINDKDLSTLLTLIASKPDGIVVAINIFSTRLYRAKNENINLSHNMASFGQKILLRISLEPSYSSLVEYKLGKIVSACYVGTSAQTNAEILCGNLADTFNNNRACSYDFELILSAIATIQPTAFLDFFLGSIAKHNNLFQYTHLRQDADLTKSPIEKIDDTIIIEWCNIAPKIRYAIIASSIVPYKNNKDGRTNWTSLALDIINKAPDITTILNEFKVTFTPNCWSDSKADIMQKGLLLITGLKINENPIISEWACQEETIFAEEIRQEREWELKKSQHQNERFE
ncbi:MAG: hypothetical protein methR_P0837 [Methyloprofundus sp.]|nr:MAG: hypothetical protein methR_P0837 [Methyloprofundus sp.]